MVTVEQTDWRTDGRMDKQTDERMDKWMDERTDYGQTPKGTERQKNSDLIYSFMLRFPCFLDAFIDI